MRTDQPSPPPWDRKERKLDRGGSSSGSGSGAGAGSDAAGGARWREQQQYRGRPGVAQRDSGRFEPPRRPPPGHHHRLYTENSPSRSDRFHSPDERRHSRDSPTTNLSSFRRSPYSHNNCSPSDIPKRPPNDPPIVTTPHSLAIPISSPKPSPQSDSHGDTKLGQISWKPLKWTRPVSETAVKDGAVLSSPVLSPQVGGDEVAAASRKKARLGWGQGLAKYEKEKVQGSVESSGGPSGPSGPSELSGFNAPPVTSPATNLSATSRPPLQDEKPCAATVSIENTISSNQTAPEPKELSIDLENVNSDSVNSLSSILSNLMQQEDSCTGDSTFLTKVSLLKLDISKELEKTECEIDSLELELKSLDSESKTDNNNNKNSESSPPVLPEPCEVVLMDCDKLNESENTESREAEETTRVCDNKSTELIEPSSSNNSCDEYSYGKLISSIIASNEDSKELSEKSINRYTVARSAIQKYRLVWSPEVRFWESVKEASLRRNDDKIREKLKVRKREVKFKERVLAMKFIALRRLWKADLRLLEAKRSFNKSGKRAALSSVPVMSQAQKQRGCVRSLLAQPDGVSALVPSSEILQYSRNLLENAEVRKYREFEKMPSQIIDDKEKQNSLFISKNGLIEDPVSFERARSTMNPWTKEEMEIFKEKLVSFDKKFTIVSSFLDHKTTADCVEFYYKNIRSESFADVRKRLELKRIEEEKLKQNKSESFLKSQFGRKWRRESGGSSLDVLDATSIDASYNQYSLSTGTITGTGSRGGKQKGSYTGTKSRTSHSSLEDKESLAADVLAGISKAVSSEAVSSCITGQTGSTDPVSKTGQTGRVKTRVKSLDEDSEESCGDELVSPDWLDVEKSLFLQAYNTYGKDFVKISNCIGTRSRDECKVFFSKAKRSLGLSSLSDKKVDEPGSPAGDVCAAEIDSGICSLQSCSKVGGGVVGHVINESSNDGSSENEISVDKQETGIVTDLNDKPVCEEEQNRSFGKIDLEVKLDVELSVKKESVPVLNLEDIGKDTGTGFEMSTKDGGERPTGTGTGLLRERARSPNLVLVPHHQTGTARSRRRASVDLGTSNVISFALDPGTVNENVPSSRPASFGTGYNPSQLPLEILPFMLKENQANSRSIPGSVPGSIPVPFSQAFSIPTTTAFSFNGNNNSNNNLSNLSQTTLNFEDHLNKNSVPSVPVQLYMQKNPLTNQTNQMMPVLKGYPLQVPNHKRNEFAQPNPKSAFVLNNNNNNNPGVLFAAKRDETEQRPEKAVTNVKLFGKILTQSVPSEKEKPISNENIQRNPSPKPNNNPSLEFLNGTPSNLNNGFFLPPGNLGLDGLPVRSYGFWDGNRIQTGFASLPESARIVAKYQESLAGVLPTTNLSGNVNNNHNVGLSSFQQPHMQQFVLNGGNNFGMVVQQAGVGTGTGTGTGTGLFRPVSVSDPVAALKMHFGSNGGKICSNNNNNSSGGEKWR
ncbi:hypothetical protein LUZ60_013053 [Juncus effusus]|nr:hypothetical protein LUZ60_013053 [Juncus effusus]